MKRTRQTIAIDFDGVIHAYSKGWQDGTIYDEPVPGALETIACLLERGYAVYIHSARSPRKIKRWLARQRLHDGPVSAQHTIPLKIVPLWYKFWDTPGVLGITSRKMAAAIYIDDRAYHFDTKLAPMHWAELLEKFP